MGRLSNTDAALIIARRIIASVHHYDAYDADDVELLCNGVLELASRRADLLATIARISQSAPLDVEVSEALEQRGKLLAEIGTLKARVAELEIEVQVTRLQAGGPWCVEHGRSFVVGCGACDATRARLAKA